MEQKSQSGRGAPTPSTFRFGAFELDLRAADDVASRRIVHYRPEHEISGIGIVQIESQNVGEVEGRDEQKRIAVAHSAAIRPPQSAGGHHGTWLCSASATATIANTTISTNAPTAMRRRARDGRRA